MYTFLQAVNLSMKASKLIEGSAGNLTAFTSNTMQHDVDVMLQSWNEIIRELLRTGTHPQETANGTITLVTGTAAYAPASDFESMVGNPIDATNENELFPYPGGWVRLRSDRPDRSDFQGLPLHWCINTTDGNLELDAQPTSGENGRVYTYLYGKRINLSATTDTFPFSDSVVDSLVPAVTQQFKRKRQGEFDATLYSFGMANAAKLIRQRESYPYYGLR